MKIIWATRGRAWGFRFLLDAELPDPLPSYDLAFDGTDGDRTVCQRVGDHVALRFSDPEGRQDEAGRIIPHDIVLLSPLADDVHSVDDGLRIVWPLLADAFAAVWDQGESPTRESLGKLLDNASPAPGVDTPRGEGLAKLSERA